MSKTQKLVKARVNKDDEFYTLYSDIEKAIPQFKEQLKNKVVFLNCDSKESNFFKYFWNNFNELGIKRLLQCSSNFSGENSIKMLEKADIVITNPPFSKIREFFGLVMDKKKDFIIIAPVTAVGYKNIFPFIAKEKVSVFGTRPKGFKRPTGNIKKVAALWLTTLKTKPKKTLVLKTCDIGTYQELWKSKIININRSSNIPNNYFGKMAVPITFIEKWNREQFEIVNICKKAYVSKGLELKRLFSRIIIKRRK